MYSNLIPATNNLLNPYPLVAATLPTQKGSNGEVDIRIHFTQLCLSIFGEKIVYLSQIFQGGYDHQSRFPSLPYFAGYRCVKSLNGLEG